VKHNKRVVLLGLLLGILVGKLIPLSINVPSQYRPTFLILGIVMALVVIWQVTKKGDVFLLASAISFVITTLLYVTVTIFGRGPLQYNWGSWKYGPDEFLVTLLGSSILCAVGWRWRCRVAHPPASKIEAV